MDVLDSTVSKLTLDEENWNQALNLLKKLIQCHPIYASQGLETAQESILSYMKINHWENVFESIYTAQEIQHHEDYVHVHAFGSLYADYHTFSKKNVIGIINGYHPGSTLLLNGHVDVDLVSSPNSWSHYEGWKSGEVIENDIIGRGACDMLSGLVSLITIANILHQNRHRWKGRVIVTSVVDEEIGGNGTLQVLQWLKSRKYLDGHVECLIAEPSNRKICTESLGFMHLLMEFKRHSVHMGVALKENSALWDMHQFIGDFDHILLEAAQMIKPDINPELLIFNFGIVNGGVDSALPISELNLEGTAFFPEYLNVNELVKSLRKVIEKRGIVVNLVLGDFNFKGAKFPPGKLFRFLNDEPYSPGIFPSPCDARLLKQYNIPTVIFGPGYLEQAHAVDEFINLDEVKDYIRHILNRVLHYLD